MLRLWDLQVVWSLPGQKALRRWIMMVRLCCCTGETCQFWNMAFKEHMMCHSSCKGDLTLNDGKCKKWRLGWELAVKCNRCSFKSDSMKVYVEAPSHTGGRRSTRVKFWYKSLQLIFEKTITLLTKIKSVKTDGIKTIFHNSIKSRLYNKKAE